jgi:hypothetical protein
MKISRIKILPNMILHCVFRKVFLCILCFLSFAFPAFAQSDVAFIGDDRIGMDISFQFGNVDTKTVLGDGIGGIGGRVGYYLGYNVFLDGEIFYQPEGLFGLFGDHGISKTIVFGGMRIGTIFNNTIGVFAKTRTGTIRLNAKTYGLVPEKNLYPIIDVGVIGEYYFKRNYFIRIDLGDWIIPFGDTKTPYPAVTKPSPESPDTYTRIGTKHNFALEFGLGFYF